MPYSGLSDFLDPATEHVRNWASEVNKCNGNETANGSEENVYLNKPVNHSWGNRLQRVLAERHEGKAA